MLKPLQQWVCDRCQNVIESPEKGYVEWIDGDDELHRDYRIIHAGGQCHHHLHAAGLSDSSLEDFVGPTGLVKLLSVLDVGAYHDPNFVGHLRIKPANVRNYVETFRRLQLPYYEEARLYWDQATEDGVFDGINLFGSDSPPLAA
jgi:hypothetical protein